MLKIQKRDEYILKKMAEYGVLNNKTINRMYGNMSQYPIRRRKRLSEEKYIIKNNVYSRLGIKGKEYLVEELGFDEKDIREIVRKKYTHIRIGKIAEILTAIEDIFETYPSWKIKNSASINERKDKYYGKIISRHNGKEFYIYNLGKITSTKFVNKAIFLKKKYMDNIRDEILSKDYIDRVIILAEDRSTMDLYNRTLVSLNLKEQIMVPWIAAGFSLIKSIGCIDIDQKVVSYLYDDFYEGEWAYADYSTEDGQVVVLAANDAEKIVRLKHLEIANRYNKTKFMPIVICLESQYRKFKKEFGNMEIKTVPDSIIKIPASDN